MSSRCALRQRLEARRREVGQHLLQFHAAGRTDGYELEQCQHWFYCLSEMLGGDRLEREEFWAWVKRVGS